jgi:DNA-directed RNA polymerase II subunit RPB1
MKKILECVCFECGKLKVDASNPLFARARTIRDQKRRAREVWNLAKNVMICEGEDGEEDEFQQPDPDKPKKVPHGGCGARQPKIRRDGLKLLAVSTKTDEVSQLR